MDWKKTNRITVVTGHFGSGKTEFSINLALHLKSLGENVALVDLDIINMYFRIREQEEFLKEHGVNVYSTIMKVTSLDIPALDPAIDAVLRDKNTRVIVDVGGNPSGARALGRYEPTLREMGYDQVFVVNANRPETESPDQIIKFMEATQAQSQTFVNGLINTSHLLKATTVDDILRGSELIKEVSKQTGLPILTNVAKRELVDELKEKAPELNVFPVDLLFRSNWML